VASIGCVVAVAVLALAGGGEIALEIGVRLSALAFVAAAAALVHGWSALLPASLVLLGAAYATRLHADDVALDAKAPLVGAGILLAAELGYWSLEERNAVHAEPGEVLRRVGFVAGLVLASLGVGAVLLAVADLGGAGGLAIDLLGALAAAAALAVIFVAARRPRQS
jgi:hypothetical protein